MKLLIALLTITAATMVVSPAYAQSPAARQANLGADASAETLSEEAHSAGRIDYSCGPDYHPYDYYPRARDRARLAKASGSSRGLVGLYSGVSDSRLWWAWGSHLRAGDTVSLDWSDDRGRSYHACHAKVARGHTSVTTGAVNLAGDRRFRACVKNGGSWRCTRGWWNVRGS